MSFSVTDFSSQLTFGGARPSLFEVRIFNPIDTSAEAITPFMVKAAQIPAARVGTITVPYFGRQIKIAGNRTFDAWTPTIINDEDFKVRNALEKWNNAMNSHEINQRTSTRPETYKGTTASVTQFGKDGSVLKVYEFVGLWCSDIEPIDLSWETEGIEEFTVTFQYDYWKVTGGTYNNNIG